MGIYVSHQSAVRYWLCKSGDECVPNIAFARSLEHASANSGDLREARLPLSYNEDDPLHVLVRDKNEKRNTKGLVCHTWTGPIPDNSFNELLDGNLMSSPEFTFLQMAKTLSFCEAVRLGNYLCGSFSVGANGRDYIGGRAPLTNPRLIGSFLERCKGAPGIANARRALKYIVPGAASPMEVFLAMTFNLPAKEGGWGMPTIEANQPIEVDERLIPLAGTDHYVGDVYLPTVHGDVEYDSYQYHTGRYRLDHTQERRNVLEVMGIKTMSATWGQIDTFEKFATFVWALKKRFGIRQKEYPPRVVRAQEDLYQFLTKPESRLFS